MNIVHFKHIQILFIRKNPIIDKIDNVELAPEKQKSLSMQKSSDNICPVNNISCDIVYLHSISILNFCGIHKVNQFICEVVVRIKLNNRLKALIMGQTQLDSNTFLPVRDLLLAWLGSQTHLFHRKKKKTLIMSFLYFWAGISCCGLTNQPLSTWFWTWFHDSSELLEVLASNKIRSWL